VLHVTLQDVKVACRNIAAFWCIVPCSLVEVDRRFRTATASITMVIALMIGTERTLEMSVYFNETKYRLLLQGCNLHVAYVSSSCNEAAFYGERELTSICSVSRWTIAIISSSRALLEYFQYLHRWHQKIRTCLVCCTNVTHTLHERWFSAMA
jgi:hypothetical protein